MSRWVDRMLAATAAVGATCIVAAIVCAALDVRPLVFRSGSMSPAIDTGALAFARNVEVADLNVGDVVTVATESGATVTHRVVSMQRDGSVAVLTLKGDANGAPDPQRYRVRAADRVMFDIPWVGYPVGWMRTMPGLLVAGLVGFALLAAALGRRPGGGARRAVRVVVPLVLAMGLVPATAGRSWAWFTDSGTVTSNAFATHVVVSPAHNTCATVVGLLQATLTWTADPRYDYEVVLRRVSSSAVVSTRQITGSASQVVYTGLTDFGSPSLSLAVDFQVEIRSYLANATTWRAASAHIYQYVRIGVLGLVMTCTDTSGA